MSDYAIQYVGPGHVIMSRRPEDVHAAIQEEWHPLIEMAAEAYRLDRWWWAQARRHQSRVVTRNKQRRNW